AFARCLRLEDPDIEASAVGLRAAPGADWSDTAVVETALRLITSGAVPPEAEIDCVTGRIFSPSVERIEAGAPLSPTQLREGGVYIVTGGLGGLARLIAGELARRFGAR